MNKYLLVFILALISGYCYGQSAVIRTETTPGNYDNIRSRNSGSTTWLASAARTATQTLADQTGNLWSGIVVYCNVIAAPGIETLVLSVQNKDLLSLGYVTIAANLAQVATGMITIKVFPTLTSVAAAVTGHTANDTITSTWRLVMTHSGSGSWTYSCSYQLLN